jgi:hypothetical protein
MHDRFDKRLSTVSTPSLQDVKSNEAKPNWWRHQWFRHRDLGRGYGIAVGVKELEAQKAAFNLNFAEFGWVKVEGS